MRVLALLIVALIAWYGVAWLQRDPAEEPLLVIAHRGAPYTTRTPENTLAAFRAAIDGGAGALELDVRATADDELVVLHDETVDRTTDGRGIVAQLTLDEVQALDAGDGEHVPTLIEVLDLARDADVPLFVELKDAAENPITGEQIVDLLQTEEMLDAVTIQSFDARVLTEVSDLAPGIETCWLTGIGTFDVGPSTGDPGAICPAAEMVLLNPGMIRTAHRAGRRVYPWWSTVETGVANGFLAGYGVDGLMVDDLGNAPNRDRESEPTKSPEDTPTAPEPSATA